MFLCKLKQPLLERLSSTMQARHDGSDRNVKDFGNFLVRKSFDIGQEDGEPEVLGKPVFVISSALVDTSSSIP